MSFTYDEKPPPPPLRFVPFTLLSVFFNFNTLQVNNMQWNEFTVNTSSYKVIKILFRTKKFFFLRHKQSSICCCCLKHNTFVSQLTFESKTSSDNDYIVFLFGRYSSSTSNAFRDQSFVELKPLPREPNANPEHYGSLPVASKKKKTKTFGGKSMFNLIFLNTSIL